MKKIVSLFVIFCCFLVKLEAQTIETTIQLPPQASARDLIYNPSSNKIYTANVPEVGMPMQKSVTIINGITNTIITTLEVPEGPRDFCHNTVNNRIYVANYFADSITVIDGQTNQIVALLPAGDGPRALCYNPVNNRIYCANEFSGNVTVIDGTGNTVIGNIAVGSTPRVICYNSQSNKIYVPNAGSQSLSIISGSSNTVLATLPMGNVPRGIVYNTQNNRVYVSNYGSDNVTVVDGVSNTVIATIPVGDGPTAVFHNPSGNKIYCSNVGAPGPNTPESCTISVINANTNSVIKTIIAGDEPTAFCYSTSKNKVYWVDEWSHRVSVADASTDSIIQLIPLGTGTVQPVDLCYNPVNERVYTANRLTYNITVIRDSAGTVNPATPACYIVVDAVANSACYYDSSFNFLSASQLSTTALNGTTNAADVALNATAAFVLDGVNRCIYRSVVAGSTSTRSRTLQTNTGANLRTPTGLAVSGDTLWVLDRGRNAIFRYSLNVAFTGTTPLNALASTTLTNGNTAAEALLNNGGFLFVLNNGTSKSIYRYPKTGGTAVKSRNLLTHTGAALSTVSGLTNNGNLFWLVDRGLDRSYSYSYSALFSGTANLNAASSFALSSQNLNASGISSVTGNSLLRLDRIEEVDDIQTVGENNLNLIAFPNPGSNLITVSFQTKRTEKIRILLINTLGQVMYEKSEGWSESGQQSVELRLNEMGIKAGVYFLVYSDQFQSQSLRLVYQPE